MHKIRSKPRTDLFARDRLLLAGSRGCRRSRCRRLTFADGVARRAAAAAVGGRCLCLGRRGCQPTGVEIHGHRHHDPKGGGPWSVGRSWRRQWRRFRVVWGGGVREDRTLSYRRGRPRRRWHGCCGGRRSNGGGSGFSGGGGRRHHGPDRPAPFRDSRGGNILGGKRKSSNLFHDEKQWT